MPCGLHAVSTLLVTVSPRVPLFPAEANIWPSQARAAEHCAQGGWEPGDPAALAAPAQETEESEKGISRERPAFSSKAMTQLTGKYTKLAESQKRKKERKKKSTKHLSRENRVPGPQRHCQSTLAEALTPGKQRNGSLYQPEKSTQVPASRSHPNPQPTPVVPPEFSGSLVQPGQDQLQTQSLIFKILCELAMLNSAESFKKEKEEEGKVRRGKMPQTCVLLLWADRLNEPSL